MNLNAQMRKLQTAIVKTGLVIKLSTGQFYSEEQRRMITSYSLSTPVAYFSERQGRWRTTDHEILKSYSMAEVIMCLADIYKAVKEWH